MDNKSFIFLKENHIILDDIGRSKRFICLFSKMKKEEISVIEFRRTFRSVLEFRNVSVKKFNKLFKDKTGEDFLYFEELLNIVRKHSYLRGHIPAYTVANYNGPGFSGPYYKPKEAWRSKNGINIDWQAVFKDIKIEHNYSGFLKKTKGNILVWSSIL